MVQSSIASSIVLPSDVLDEVRTVQRRGAILSRVGRTGLLGSTVLIAAGAAWHYFGGSSPPSSFSTVDIPQVLLGAKNAFSTPIDTLASTVVSLANSWVVKLMGGAAVILGLLQGVFRASISSLIATAGAGMMVFMVPNLIQGLVPPEYQQPVSVLTRYVEQKDWDKTFAQLAGNNSPEAEYVRSQIAYLTKDGEGLQHHLTNLGNPTNFSVDRLYPMEMVAYGHPNTPQTIELAEQLSNEDLQHKKITWRVEKIALGAGGTFLPILIIGFFLQRRGTMLQSLVCELDPTQEIPKDKIEGCANPDPSLKAECQCGRVHSFTADAPPTLECICGQTITRPNPAAASLSPVSSTHTLVEHEENSEIGDMALSYALSVPTNLSVGAVIGAELAHQHVTTMERVRYEESDGTVEAEMDDTEVNSDFDAADSSW